MKLKNVFDHNFISFQANASIPDSRERYRRLLSLQASQPKLFQIWKRYGGLKFVKGVGIGGHEDAVMEGRCYVDDDEGEWWFGRVQRCGWWVLWGGVLFCFVTLASCSRQSVIKWPVWPTVYDLCLKFCFGGHPGHQGPGFGVRLIFKYTCSNCNLQSSPWPLRHSIGPRPNS